MRKPVALLLSLALVTMTTSLSAFHLSLLRSDPAEGQKLTKAPTKVELWFSEEPAAGVSEIKLTRGTDAVALGKTTVVAKEKSMYAEPAKPLPAGQYTIAWRTAGDDGHVREGKIAFTINEK